MYANGQMVILPSCAHFLNGSEFPLVLAELALDEVQVVPQWLHVWVDLVLGITGQEPQVLVAQRYNGACQYDLVVAVFLLQCAQPKPRGFSPYRPHRSP